MLLLKGEPLIRDEVSDVSEYVPTPETYVGASGEQAWEQNPYNQARYKAKLNSLQPGDTYYTTETGEQVLGTKGLDPADPRARRLSLDEANDKGGPIGLRFSEPPTQGQFDYLADLKRGENERAVILSKAPDYGSVGMGFVAALGASAIDPINAASAFVPIVGPARYASMVARMGTTGARLAKGALEGGAGMLMVTPLVYSQAQTLQQDYDLHSALLDVTIGTAFGAGMHLAGGLVGDAFRGRMHSEVNRIIGNEMDRRFDAMRAKEERTPPADRRKVRVQEGENGSIVESMDPDSRAKVMNAAVKAVATDVVPRVDELLKTSPELRELTIPDKRFPATLRLISDVTAADFATGTRSTAIFDHVAEKMARGKDGVASPQRLYDRFAKQYKKLSDFAFKTVTPEEFNARTRDVLESPDQRVAIEEGSKTILMTEGASMGAVRHEIERAIDLAYGVTGDEAGGYRYRNKDVEMQSAHRAALRELYGERPDRAPRTATASEAVDLFSRRDEKILGHEGPADADHAWDAVEKGKDLDLETMIKDEEIAVVEDIARNITGAARDLGIMEKVIPLEERQILEEAAANQGKQKVVKDLFSAVDGAVERGVNTEALDHAEILLRDGVDTLKAVILEGKTTKQATLDAIAKAPELVTRSQALRSINAFVEAATRTGKDVVAPSGASLERAIRMVQDGEDIDVAVQGAGLLARADAAAEAPAGEAAEFKAPGEEKAVEEDLFGDLAADAEEILKDILSKRELADAEARLVLEEHIALDANPKTRDLASSIERTEFHEAQRDRALREGSGSLSSGERARAGSPGAGRPLEDGLFSARTGRDGEAARGQGAAAEREASTAGGERAAPETAVSYGAGTVPRRIITPDGSIEVSVEPKFVELNDLIHAEGDLQVRDRSRKESDVEAFERALKLDPEQLLPNRVADAGAPIVVPAEGGGYTIISGNGRVLSLRKVYGDETLTWKANQYRDRLGPAADGYRRPVLVSVITDSLSHDELVKFAERANRSRIAEMSITEKAQRDADAAGIDLMMLYQGGDFTKKENQAFLRAFMRKVATVQEMGEMSKNGVLTKTGVDRLNAAVLASAYDDTGVLSLMLESTDNNIKSISNAYRDAAPIFMKLRAEIAQGLVREEMDITPFMMEAARFVQDARDRGVKIVDALAQVDAFNPMDPVVDRLIRQFYGPDLKRAGSSLRIAENLKLYAEAAREKRLGGFLEDNTTPLDVMGAAERKLAREADETLLAAPEDDAGPSAGEPGRQIPEPAPEAARVVPEDRGSGGGQEAPAEPAAQTGPTSLTSIFTRNGEEALRAHMATFKTLKALRDEAERQKIPHKGRSREQVENAILKSVAEIRNGRLAAAGGSSGTVADRLLDPEERATMRGEPEGLSDEQIDALPEPVEVPAPAAENPHRERFYNYLEGDKPIKDTRTLAKALGIDNEAAYKLIEEGVDAGWLKQKESGTYIRVPKTQRPARPGFDETPSFADAPRSLAQVLDDEGLGREISSVSELRANDQHSLIIGGDGKLWALGGESFPHREVYEHIDFLREGGIQVSMFKGLDGTVEIGGQLKGVSRQAFMRLGRVIRDAGLKRSDVLWRIDPHDNTGLFEFLNITPSRDRARYAGFGYKPLPDAFADLPTGMKQSFDDAPSFSQIISFDYAKDAMRERRIEMLTERRNKLFEDIDQHRIQLEKLREVADDDPRLNELYGQIDSVLTKAGALNDEIRALQKEAAGRSRRARAEIESNEEWHDLKADEKMHEGIISRATKELEAAKSKSDFESRRNAQIWTERLSSSASKLGEIQAKIGTLEAQIDSTVFALEFPELSKLHRDLSSFIDSGRKNTWIYGDNDSFSLYVRNNQRTIDGKWVPALDISSVEVRNTGKGSFKQMLGEIEKVAILKDIHTLYVENVLTERFANFFRKNGWQEEPSYGRGNEPSFIKKLIGNLDELESAAETVRPPKGWDVVEGDPMTLERDLQATLTIQRAIGDAAHRLPDVIKFEMLDYMSGLTKDSSASGAFMPRKMMVVLSKAMLRSATEVVNHEIFHALRYLKLFTDFEWNIIRNTYEAANGISPEQQRRYRAFWVEEAQRWGKDETDPRIADKLTEEWAATDHGKWAEKRNSERETPLGMLHQRVRDFLKDLRASFENLARRAVGKEEKFTADEIFRAIEDGTIAKRWEEWGMNRADSSNPMSAKSMAIDDTTKMMNKLMRENASDDSEKVARVTEEALKALAPCAAYNL